MRWNGNRTASYEKSALKAILCYFLCLALVALYSCFHLSYPTVDSSDFVPGSDYSKDWGSYVWLSTKLIHGWSVTNAEGQNLHCIHRQFVSEKEVNLHSLYGDMKYSDSFNGWIYIPFSRSISVQIVPYARDVSPRTNSKREMTTTERLAWQEQQKRQKKLQLFPSPCRVSFHNKAGKGTATISVDGFSGTLVFHSDKSVELYGDTRNVTVCFWTQEAMWTVRGSGGLYAKVAVVDGEIEVEGLTSYEVEREKSVFT